jgi:hypothetical protein
MDVCRTTRVDVPAIRLPAVPPWLWPHELTWSRVLACRAMGLFTINRQSLTPGKFGDAGELGFRPFNADRVDFKFERPSFFIAEHEADAVDLVGVHRARVP